MYTATPLSKHRQYASHICDRQWLPAHTQHTTTNNNDIDEIDDHNNEEQQEQYHKYHNHHNHHQQPSGNSIMSCVVWAIWWVFFFLRVFYLLLNNIYSNYDYIKATEGLREDGDKENGPKRRDSRCLGH